MRDNKKELKTVIRAFNKKTGKLVNEFNNVKEASNELNCDKYRIAKALKGSIKSSGVYRFEYCSIAC